MLGSGIAWEARLLGRRKGFWAGAEIGRFSAEFNRAERGLPEGYLRVGDDTGTCRISDCLLRERNAENRFVSLDPTIGSCPRR